MCSVAALLQRERQILFDSLSPSFAYHCDRRESISFVPASQPGSSSFASIAHFGSTSSDGTIDFTREKVHGPSAFVACATVSIEPLALGSADPSEAH